MQHKLVARTAGDIALVDFEPQPPREGEIAGPTLVTLISPGTELAIAFGSRSSIELPSDLGYSAVFRVAEVGANVDAWRPGDLAVTLGPHASWQCRPEQDALRLPAGLASEKAVFARMMNVPMSAIATSAARPGRSSAVSGLGLIGQLSVRVLLASGFEVIAADLSESRRALLPEVVSAGPDLPVESVDLLIECSGTEEGVVSSMSALRPGGELVISGVPWRQRSDASAFDVLDPLFHKFVTVRSGWEWQLPWRSGQWVPGMDLATLMERSLRWLADGTVDVEGLATSCAPSEAADFYRALKSRVAPTLTAVIEWQSKRF